MNEGIMPDYGVHSDLDEATLSVSWCRAAVSSALERGVHEQADDAPVLEGPVLRLRGGQSGRLRRGPVAGYDRRACVVGGSWSASRSTFTSQARRPCTRPPSATAWAAPPSRSSAVWAAV